MRARRITVGPPWVAKVTVQSSGLRQSTRGADVIHAGTEWALSLNDHAASAHDPLDGCSTTIDVVGRISPVIAVHPTTDLAVVAARSGLTSRQVVPGDPSTYS